MNTSKKITIGTHNGIFHLDEVVAIALLSIIHGTNIGIKRSREPNILSTCNYVIDVGGGEFDHHMPEGNGKRANGIPFASAGLIWKKYSDEILKACGCPEDHLYDARVRVDKNIIEPVDKIDNGKDASSIFSFIPYYIPNWNEDFKGVDKQFNKAFTLTRKILITAICKEIANAESDRILYTCIDTKDRYSHILEIPNQYIDWKPIVIESNSLPNELIYFVVFPYPSGGYAAQAVPPSLEKDKEQLVSFPKEWAGLTTTLPQISGVATATFCHNNLFFIRAETREDVIKLCEIAIDRC